MEFRHLAIEGPAGVGKSALADRLGARLDATIVLDESDNPFLADFYNGRPGAAFQAQLFYTLARHRQQTLLRQADLFSQTMICDYLFERDKIYAYLNLDDNELFVYQRLYELLSQDVPTPDLVIYLQASIATLAARVRKRGNPIEGGLDEDYLRRVSDAYSRYFYDYAESPLLIVNSDRLNFVDTPEHLDLLVQRIDAMRGGREFFNRG